MTAPIRSAAKQRLYSLAADALTGVQVTYSEPSTFATRCVWFGPVSGGMGPGPMKSGRKIRMDEFTIEVHILAFGGGADDGYEMDVAAEALLAEVDSVVADSSTLAVDGSGLPGLTFCRMTDGYEGPNCGPMEIAGKVAGYGSEITANVLFHTRLT